jgi:hypothetical protein
MRTIPCAKSGFTRAAIAMNAVVLLITGSCSTAIAKSASAKKSAAGASSTTLAGPTDNSPGAVLKNVSMLAHRLRRASLDVINDIEQRDMVVTGEPELIQPIAMKDDDKAIGWAQKMEDLGPALPPKKSWLDTDVSNVAEIVNLLSADMSAVQLPDSQKDSWNDLKAIVAEMKQHLQDLQAVSKGPKYDNLVIGKQALKIYDDVKRLEAPWKTALQASRQ